MEKPYQDIFESILEKYEKNLETLTDTNERIRKVVRERKPIPDKKPSLADLGRVGLPETLLRKMDENEDEAEETPSSAAKGKANGWITKRSSEETPTHSKGSERADALAEALEEAMRYEENRRERRQPIPGKPSSSLNNGLKMAGGELSVLGMGGIGETNIQNNGTTTNFTFGTIQMTNHHHYYKEERRGMNMTDADEQ